MRVDKGRDLIRSEGIQRGVCEGSEKQVCNTFVHRQTCRTAEFVLGSHSHSQDEENPARITFAQVTYPE